MQCNLLCTLNRMKKTLDLCGVMSYDFKFLSGNIVTVVVYIKSMLKENDKQTAVCELWAAGVSQRFRLGLIRLKV